MLATAPAAALAAEVLTFPTALAHPHVAELEPFAALEAAASSTVASAPWVAQPEGLARVVIAFDEPLTTRDRERLTRWIESTNAVNVESGELRLSWDGTLVMEGRPESANAEFAELVVFLLGMLFERPVACRVSSMQAA